MADTGYKTCGTVGSYGGWTGEPTPANLQSDDGSEAQAYGPNYCPLEISDFSFGIPSGATILGIEVNGKVRVSSGTGSLRVSLSKDNGHTYTSTEVHTTTTDEMLTFGGSTSLWGTTWIDTDFENGTFQAMIEAKNSIPTATYLDYLAVTVYYFARALKTILGLEIVSVKTVEGLEIASVKTVDGLA